MSMNRKQIIEKLKEIFVSADEKNLDLIDEINDNTELLNELGLNSVNMLFFMIAAEEEFGIRFTDIGMNDLKTVGEVADYIEGKLQ